VWREASLTSCANVRAITKPNPDEFQDSASG
jgi:hypothetical protein